MKKHNEYALYKGDECLAIGTIKQIAKQMGKTEKAVTFYTYPVYKKRSMHKERLFDLVLLGETKDFEEEEITTRRKNEI